MNTLSNSGNHNIILQDIRDSKITLTVDGDLKEISAQLTDLKNLLVQLQAQNIQYGGKLYHIDRINNDNFDYLTGKKLFNERLTIELVKLLSPINKDAERIVATPNWDNNLNNLEKIQLFLIRSFVGAIGIQIGKLMALGKTRLTENKQQLDYVEACVHVVKRCFDLTEFVLISRWWDIQNKQALIISEEQKKAVTKRIDNTLELSLTDHLEVLKILIGFFNNEPEKNHPIPELKIKIDELQDNGNLANICKAIDAFDSKVSRSNIDLVDCFEAEALLIEFFRYFHFWVNYRMVSIRRLGYRHIKNDDPHYLHYYTFVDFESINTNKEIEKIKYTSQAIQTDAVLLFSGENYSNCINLFPFVIDYNALTLDKGTNICFYHSTDFSGNKWEYLSLKNDTTVTLEKNDLAPLNHAPNDFPSDAENLKNMNLEDVVKQLLAAKQHFMQ